MKQSDGVHKAGNILADVHTKRRPLYHNGLQAGVILSSTNTHSSVVTQKNDLTSRTLLSMTLPPFTEC